MVKWDEEHKFKLLLAIIEHLNPGSLPWDKIASNMGPDVSVEACRGQYKTIKKGFKSTTPKTPATSAPKAKASAPASKGKARPSANNSRKRKAAPVAASDDDEEEATTTRKSSKKPKVEKAAAKGGAEVFKTEPAGQEGEGVDLENDELYTDEDNENDSDGV